MRIGARHGALGDEKETAPVRGKPKKVAGCTNIVAARVNSLEVRVEPSGHFTPQL